MLPPKIKRISVKLGADQRDIFRAHDNLPTTLSLEGEYAYAALFYFGPGTRFAPPELQDAIKAKIDELYSLGLLTVSANCSRWFVLDTQVEFHSSEGVTA